MRVHLIILLVVCSVLPSRAQVSDTDNLYEEAKKEYSLGRIEQAKSLLEANLKTSDSSMRLRVYRLMSLCCIALDQPAEAEHYATLMLKENPYYTPTIDYSPRFVDMVNRIKAGFSATITTASSQEERLEEVPVPATLITEEMIRNSGARNLQEVLAAYVPGMHIIDCNDDINISMRGIYSNSQEKILIMLNGHRMNSYSTNIAAPDFSISLDKLKQIEVLRGPASSLYGGVALTAVVNLITKQGADVDGVEVKAGIGNYGQQRGDLLLGKRYYDLDILAWGSIYKSSGEERDAPERNDIYGMPQKYVTIGRIGNKPSYDFGIQLTWKDLRFLYDSHFSEVIAPFTMTTLATSYAHDKYKTFQGNTPSFATSTRHADLSYSRRFGKLSLTGALSYDTNDETHYQVIYDGPLSSVASMLGLPAELDSIFKNSQGTARYIQAKDYSYGASVKGDFAYIDNGRHKGTLAFGAEYSHFKLEDVSYQIVYDFAKATPDNYALQELGKGRENSYNAFVQLKHHWQSFIINGGLRYDHKVRYDNTKLDVLSPRIALIYLQPKWNAKLSYSKSFVDAPYLYRKSNDFQQLLSGQSIENSVGIDPETVHSVQLSFAGTQWIKGLNFEVNAFYNRANDLIITHVIDYRNGGDNKSVGVELTANYRHPRFTVDYNLTWTHTLSANLFADPSVAEYIDAQIDANNNTPALMSNAVLSWRATQRLKLFTHIAFESKQTSYNTDFVVQTKALNDMKEAIDLVSQGEVEKGWQLFSQAIDLFRDVIWQGEMNPRLIFNLGAEYQWRKLTFGLNIHNLLNTQYFQSGMNTKLVPQKGRWAMLSVGYKF